MEISSISSVAWNGLNTEKEQNEKQGLQLASSVGQGVEVTTAETFAQNIAQRIQENADEDKDGSGLQSALSSTVDFIRTQFGEEAATASMGLIYKSLGEGEVTEENLGNGLLNALKLVDRNLGTAAGDQLIAHLNQELNPALNEYFDNGLNEQFMVAPSDSGSNVMAGLMNHIQNSLDDESAQTFISFLQEAMQDDSADERSLIKGLEQGLAYLQDNPDQAQEGQEQLRQAFEQARQELTQINSDSAYGTTGVSIDAMI